MGSKPGKTRDLSWGTRANHGRDGEMCVCDSHLLWHRERVGGSLGRSRKGETMVMVQVRDAEGLSHVKMVDSRGEKRPQRSEEESVDRMASSNPYG